MYNLYKVVVRNQSNKVVETYFLTTEEVMPSSIPLKPNYLKTYLLLKTYNTTDLAQLFKEIKTNYLNYYNLDYHHITDTMTYYIPAIKTRPQQNTIPFAHSDPSKEVQIRKLNTDTYRSLVLKTPYEKILERQVFIFSIPESLYDTYFLYFKTPVFKSCYTYYISICNDDFKAFLLFLRDITTLLPIQKEYYYYSYMPLPEEKNPQLLLIGTYSKKVIENNKGLKDWIKNDYGKNLRSSMLLLPLPITSIESLWNTIGIHKQCED